MKLLSDENDCISICKKHVSYLRMYYLLFLKKYNKNKILNDKNGCKIANAQATPQRTALPTIVTLIAYKLIYFGGKNSIG